MLVKVRDKASLAASDERFPYEPDSYFFARDGIDFK
jgi:hypothetical protein